VTVMTGLPLDDTDRARSLIEAYRALGVERLVCGLRYGNLAEYGERLEALASLSAA